MSTSGCAATSSGARSAFAEVDREQFLDFKWQMKHSVYGEDKLIEAVRDIAPADWLDDAIRGFKLAPMAVRVTPYLLALIDWSNPYTDPIRTQFIPIASRLTPDHPMLTLDSLHEQDDAPVPGLTHRYTDKALFLPLDTCPSTAASARAATPSAWTRTPSRRSSSR